jgi:hypothetical protein
MAVLSTIQPKVEVLTTTTGSASVSLLLSNGFVRQLIVKATTSSTTFDLSITNAENFVVLNEVDIFGELNEFINLPHRGNLTLAIDNASADEVFDVYLAWNE